MTKEKETPMDDFCKGNMADVVRYRTWKEEDNESVMRTAEARNVVVFPLAVGGWLMVSDAQSDHPQGLYISAGRLLEIEFSEKATQVAMMTGIMSYAQMMEAMQMMKDSERGRDR